jgi:hypothetical protein
VNTGDSDELISILVITRHNDGIGRRCTNRLGRSREFGAAIKRCNHLIGLGRHQRFSHVGLERLRNLLANILERLAGSRTMAGHSENR